MRSLTTLFVLLVVFMAPGSFAHAQATEPASKTAAATSGSASKEEVNQLRSEVEAQRKTIDELKAMVQQLVDGKTTAAAGTSASVKPAATDSTRVLRLPGFANRKLPGEFIVQARYECDAVYTLRDFVIGETAPEMPRNVALTRRPTPTVSAKNKTQSERDWAFAKRALSRGEDPSTVIQRIAAFRGKDKPSPEYYARLTVNKAKAALG